MAMLHSQHDASEEAHRLDTTCHAMQMTAHRDRQLDGLIPLCSCMEGSDVQDQRKTRRPQASEPLKRKAKRGKVW